MAERWSGLTPMLPAAPAASPATRLREESGVGTAPEARAAPGDRAASARESRTSPAFAGLTIPMSQEGAAALPAVGPDLNALLADISRHPGAAPAVAALQVKGQLSVGWGARDRGSGYDPAEHRITIDGRHQTADARLVRQLVLHQLLVAHDHLLPPDEPDAAKRNAFNTRHDALWRAGAESPEEPREGYVRFYHATNRENLASQSPDEPGIAVAGLDPRHGGSRKGVKRWEQIGREHKDVGKTTVTTDLDRARAYAAEHTEKEAVGRGRDPVDSGGTIVYFDAPKADFQGELEKSYGEGAWMRDNSGDRSDFQTTRHVEASELRYLEPFTLPRPNLRIGPPPMGPPPMGGPQPAAEPAPAPGAGAGQRRRRYPVPADSTTKQ